MRGQQRREHPQFSDQFSDPQASDQEGESGILRRQ